MQSRVSLDGVVLPATKRELERLVDVRQRCVAAVLRWHLPE